MSWISLLGKGAKEAVKLGGKTAQTTGKIVGGALKGTVGAHPIMTAGGVLLATEAAKANGNDTSTVHQIVSDLSNENVADIVDNGLERRAIRSDMKTSQLASSAAGDTLAGSRGAALPSAVDKIPEDGIADTASTFFSSLSGGSQSLNSFFDNMRSGRFGTLSIIGLVAAAALIFGRHGFLGKVAGLILGLNVLSSHSPNAAVDPKLSLAAQQQVSQNFSQQMQQAESQERSNGISRKF